MGQYSKDLSFDHTSKNSKKSSTCPQSATKRMSSFKKKSQRRQRQKSLRPLRRLQQNLKKRQKSKVFTYVYKSRISKSPKHHDVHIISTTTNLIHLRKPKAAQIHSILKIYFQHRSNMYRYSYV